MLASASTGIGKKKNFPYLCTIDTKYNLAIPETRKAGQGFSPPSS